MSGLDKEIVESVEEDVTGVIEDELQYDEKPVVNDGANDVVELIERGANKENEINVLNWLNLASFILNTVITYAVGVGGILGNGTTNSDLSKKYQTLVTPKGTAFAIWGIIFGFQAAFVIAQFFPKFRATQAVQTGVSFWYVAVCLFQSAWSFAFAKEVLWLAVVFMFGIWISLVAILFNQYYINSERSILDYFLLRFPFDVHAGWITVAFLLNVNVLFVGEKASATSQLCVGIVSLSALWAVSVFLLFALVKNANYTMALVFIWAISFIAVEINASDNTKIKALFSQTILKALKATAFVLVIGISIQIVARVTIDILNHFVTPRKISPENEEGGNESISSDDDKRVPLLADSYDV